MTQPDVAQSDDPLARGGVFLLVWVALEMVEHGREVELLAVLQYVDIQARQHQAANVDRLGCKFQQAGSYIKGVESGKRGGAVGFIDFQTAQVYVAVEEVYPCMVEVHLPTDEFLAVRVDHSFGYRAGQQ